MLEMAVRYAALSGCSTLHASMEHDALIQIIERLTKIETNSTATLEQTTKTNGRVTKLEEGQSRITIALVFCFGLVIGFGLIDMKTALSLLL